MIAASCAVLSVAVLAEYVFSMAARVPGTATVRDIMLALAVLAGLVGGMIVLTNTQMRSIFLAVAVLLPLSVVVIGLGVWWRRRR